MISMSKHIKLVILALAWCYSLCSYSYSTSISTWITYENSSSDKWWRYSTSTTSGYAWSYSDSSSVWGGSSYYRCSDDSSSLPQNSKKLLCPSDLINCNSIHNL